MMESVETNTLGSSESELKIESELTGDRKSATAVTLETPVVATIGEYAQWYIGSDSEGHAIKIYY